MPCWGFLHFKLLLCLILSFKTITMATSQPEISMEELLKTDVVGRPLDHEDFERASQIPLSDTSLRTGEIDPIELAGLFEGDILLTPSQRRTIQTNGELLIRNAITNESKKWPNGEIPYLISQAYDNMQRAMISVAIITLQNSTCIRFVPRTTQNDYIHIVKGHGCSSPVGRTGGTQSLSLGNGCFYSGIIMHELMHTTGFWHEHSRNDRDSHITILWDNIQSGMGLNFEKYDWSDISSLGVSYDLGSIMHYGPYAFAKVRTKPTIIPRRRAEIGQRRVYSKKDLKKINTLYECPGFQAMDGVCEDRSRHCHAWAALGECKKNSKWMLINCRRSCKVCGSSEGSCVDNNIHCSYWANEGECKINPNYMMVNCQKSCRNCL